jgi:hypothetical protein
MSKLDKKRDSHQSTTIDKGKIVEGLVALLHEQPGISVQRNVHLPSTDGEETREIKERLKELRTQVCGHLSLMG